MTWRVRVRLRARLDIERAAAWYGVESSGLAERFLGSVEGVFRALADSPARYTEVIPGVRRALMPRFPYSVYFQMVDEDVVVLAVLHQRMSAATTRDRMK